MSVLTKKEILEAIAKDEIGFEPMIDQFQLSPVAIDLRVGTNFFIPRLWETGEAGRTQMIINHMDDNEKNEVLETIHITPGQYFELLPGEFILISTHEKIMLKSGSLMAILFPRSSTSRRGLSIESGVIDPFYEGYLTIPVLNQTKTQTIKIYPGERIAQLVFHKTLFDLSREDSLTHGVSKPKYQGSKAYRLDYKFDHHEEIRMIREGKVDDLKNQYKIEMDKNEETVNIATETEVKPPTVGKKVPMPLDRDSDRSVGKDKKENGNSQQLAL